MRIDKAAPVLDPVTGQPFDPPQTVGGLLFETVRSVQANDVDAAAGVLALARKLRPDAGASVELTDDEANWIKLMVPRMGGPAVLKLSLAYVLDPTWAPAEARSVLADVYKTGG